MRMSLMRRLAALCRGTILGARPAVVADNARRIRGEFLGNSSDAVLGSRRYGATPVKRRRRTADAPRDLPHTAPLGAQDRNSTRSANDK